MQLIATFLKLSMSFYFLLLSTFCLSLDKMPRLIVTAGQLQLQEFKVTGLVPHQVIRLEVTCRDQDGQGNAWHSHAEFQADANGIVDVAINSPFSGTYSIADIMGLFWSMLPPAGCTKRFTIGEKRLLPITVDLFINQKLAAQRIFCINKQEGVTTYNIREAGLVGELHVPSDHAKIKNTVVLFVGGSEGGIGKGKGQFFAQAGYVTLALAYFGVEGLPKHLENIPLEYFADAVDWLKSYCQSDQCVMMGISRGGELALLMGSIFPDKLAGIIADVPCHVVNPAMPYVTRPAWTYKEKPILDSLVGTYEGWNDPISSSFDHPYSNTVDYLKYWKKYPTEYEKATIPVEQITAPILLTGGADDAMWPSALSVQKIVDRLKRFKAAVYCKAMIFPDAGHAVRLPYLPQLDFPDYYNLPYGKLWYNYGGTTIGNAAAAAKLYPELINFLELVDTLI